MYCLEEKNESYKFNVPSELCGNWPDVFVDVLYKYRHLEYPDGSAEVSCSILSVDLNERFSLIKCSVPKLMSTITHRGNELAKEYFSAHELSENSFVPSISKINYPLN